MFYKRLRSLRKELDYSQEQIAELINVSRQSYSRYELGVSEPEFGTLVRLADIFNVSLDYLLCRTENKVNISMSPDYELLVDINTTLSKYTITKK